MAKNQSAQNEAAPVAAPRPGVIPTDGANLKNIPADRLGTMPGFNPRTEIGDTSELEGLIKKNGLVNPIAVCPIAEGADRYFVIAGARRLAACKALGHQNVPCHVYADLDLARDVLRAKAIAMAENDGEGRQALSPMDQARAFRGLFDLVEGPNDTAKHKAIAKALGRRSEGAHQNIRLTLKLLDMSARVQAMLSAGTVSKTAAISMSEMPDDVRAHVEARITPGMSEGDVRRLANDLRREAPAVAAPAQAAGPVVDLDDGSDVPKAPAAPAAAAKPRNRPAGYGDKVVLWRNKGEVRDMIDAVVSAIAVEEAEEESAKAEALRNQLAALLWCTGAIDDVETGSPDFQRALKELAGEKPGAAAEDDEAEG